MRITLSWKITTILVLFGLVPAADRRLVCLQRERRFQKQADVDRRQDGRCDQLPRRQFASEKRARRPSRRSTGSLSEPERRARSRT